jgi:hypothetical protein
LIGWRQVSAEGRQAEEKQFFFEKKNQKTFAHKHACCHVDLAAKEPKVFCFFFSKKKFFLTFPSISLYSR